MGCFGVLTARWDVEQTENVVTVNPGGSNTQTNVSKTTDGLGGNIASFIPQSFVPGESFPEPGSKMEIFEQEYRKKFNVIRAAQIQGGGAEKSIDEQLDVVITHSRTIYNSVDLMTFFQANGVTVLTVDGVETSREDDPDGSVFASLAAEYDAIEIPANEPDGGALIPDIQDGEIAGYYGQRDWTLETRETHTIYAFGELEND